MSQPSRLQTFAKGTLAVTLYVLATAAAVRIIFLTDYEAMLTGFTTLGEAFGARFGSLLVDGGIFYAIWRLIQSDVPTRLADAAGEAARTWKGAQSQSIPDDDLRAYPDDPPQPTP